MFSSQLAENEQPNDERTPLLPENKSVDNQANHNETIEIVTFENVNLDSNIEQKNDNSVEEAKVTVSVAAQTNLSIPNNLNLEIHGLFHNSSARRLSAIAIGTLAASVFVHFSQIFSTSEINDNVEAAVRVIGLALAMASFCYTDKDATDEIKLNVRYHP